MARWSVLLLGPLTALGIYACGGASTPASTTSDETCPTEDAGPPPVCPAGCVWNGTVCKKDRGVIIDYGVEAGAPPPSK